ncbi:MAG TPA: VOC family protein, partial [Phenylobacterium sp.]
EFYARHFGLADFVWHGHVLFMRDGRGMDFALDPSPAGQAPPDWFHFGFRLDSAAAVEALFARLEGAGAAIREPLTREDDLVYFRCADPDGYGIEVYWEPQP